MKNIIFWLVAMVFIISIVSLSTTHDHEVYESVPEGKITVVETTYPIFLSKGAYVIGECHKYSVNEGIVFDNTLQENQPLKAEELVKIEGQAVIYWSLDQKDEAKKLLDS